MRTLYISDLDGTLLNDKAKLTKRSQGIMKDLIDRGMLFTIATARSMQTALPIVEPLGILHPMVMMNGAILYDAREGRIAQLATIAPDMATRVLNEVRRNGLDPLLYTMDERDEQRIYYEALSTDAQRMHVGSRLADGDPRFRNVASLEDALSERCFYITVIGEKEKLLPLSVALSGMEVEHHFYYDVYTKGYFIECCPVGHNKGVGALKAKKLLCADKLVVFGDNHNDLSMFAIAEESYAVADAQEDVQNAATGVIGHSAQDAVAEFLLDRMEREGL